MTENIKLCQTCINRSFSSSQGIVCGLTNEKPNFIDTCKDFIKNEKEEKRIADRKAVMEADDLLDEDGKRVPVWRIVLSIIIAIVAIVRLIMTLNR